MKSIHLKTQPTRGIGRVLCKAKNESSFGVPEWSNYLQARRPKRDSLSLQRLGKNVHQD